MKTIRYELDNGIATITFDEPNSPVNTMCRQWQDDLTTLTAQVLQDQASIKGLVLVSAKSTFFAGADLKGVMRLKPSDAPAIFAEVELMKRNFRTLETLGKPIVTCLNGTALGGGWEVALLGHHRIAIDDPKIKLGLPEVTLGLLPGASGVTKMTRHLGLLGAQPYLIEGKTFNPQTAHKLGLVNELVEPSDHAATAMRASALAWIAAHPTAQHPWEDKNYKVPGGTPANAKLAGMLTVAPAMLKKQTRGLYPAPEAILACMVEGLQVDMPTALRIESRYLAKLMSGTNARAMINTFFNLNTLKNDPSHTGYAARAKNGIPTDRLGATNPEAEFGRRVFVSFVDEGLAMLSEGIPAAAIENAGLQCGMPAGPLAALDEASLTLCQEALATTHTTSPAKLLLARMVGEYQRPGRTGGAGFYNYPTEPEATTDLWPQLKPLFEKNEASWNITDLKDRLLYRQAIEAARCLTDKVVSSVAKANIESMLVAGYPAWTGGALQFIYGMGLAAFAARAHEFELSFGPGFALTDTVKATLEQHQPSY
jgi:enoyl-CoA hydratase/carnithine racemase